MTLCWLLLSIGVGCSAFALFWFMATCTVRYLRLSKLPQSHRERIERIKEAASRVSNNLFWKGAVYVGDIDRWVAVLDSEVGALKEYESTMQAVQSYLALVLRIRSIRVELQLDARAREAAQLAERELFLMLNKRCNRLLGF